MIQILFFLAALSVANFGFANVQQPPGSTVDRYTCTVSSRHSLQLAMADLSAVCIREAKERGLRLSGISEISVESTFPIFVTGTCEFSN